MSINKRAYLPEFIKPFLRLLRYGNERKKFVREIAIRKKQDSLLQLNYDAATGKLVVFLVNGADWATGKDLISGGIISIVSICEETAALQDLHQAATIMCTMNKEHLLLKHEKFDNHTNVFRFSQLKGYFKNLHSVMIHIPEMMVSWFLKDLSVADAAWLKAIPSVHINVMNQNIKLMPQPAVLTALQTVARAVTITTAHAQYCNRHYRDFYAVPIHKLSVWISPEQYQFTAWKDKENLLVVSPDKHPMKEIILTKLATVPGLTVQVIQNLTYQQYKKLVSRAKWALTFGEGLDGYFIEPVFSGAIAFAVFNEEFFTADFKNLPGLYASFEALHDRIIADLQHLDNSNDFIVCQQEEFDLCAKYYSKTQYRKNIAAFYNGEYTFA